MAALPPIDDSNTFPDKTEGGDPGEPTDVVSAADLNALKDRISENRAQANAALAAYAGAVTDRTASFSLTSADHGVLQVLDSSAGASVITVPHTLFGSVYTSGQFRTRVFVTNADEAVTLAGSGGVSLIYFGRNTIQTGDLITITVRSATSALVEVTPWGDDLLPMDGGTVTAATRTISVADANKIIGLDPTSNTIAVTLPHTLFWASGTGRTFQTTLVALNVTNAITLAGSGGLVLTYYGSSGTIAAGDIIRISVESQTVCRVVVSKPGVGGGLGNVFTLSANLSLDDSHSGGVIFVDTSGGARSLTIPTSVSTGWNAVIVREGANTLKVIGDGTMLMKGPAAAANEVAIAVDDGGVSVIRRSATKCWCAGVIS